MGCFPVDFQEVKRPLRTKSVKRPIKVGKRPINEGKRPIKAKVLVGVSVGCLMGCFRPPPPWRKTAPLKRPIKRFMKKTFLIESYFGGRRAKCWNLREGQKTYHPQFCTCDVDRRFYGGGAWMSRSDQGRQTFEGGHELFDHHPFAWKTPTPPGGLRTHKFNRCALLSCLIIGPAPLQKVVGDFCCRSFGGFCRGFSWRIFLGTFSHKNKEKKSGDKIRENIRRLKNKHPRKIRSAKNRP